MSKSRPRGRGQAAAGKGGAAGKGAAAGKQVAIGKLVAAANKAKPAGEVLDLERYVPALITFIANKLSRSATVLYQKRFGVNVTEWRILSLLAIEPAISAARICHVIGFDKGPVSRTLAAMEENGLVTIKPDERDGRTHAISLTSKGWATHDGVIAVALERERRLLACLRKDEQEMLIGLLRRVHGNLDAVKGVGELSQGA